MMKALYILTIGTLITFQNTFAQLVSTMEVSVNVKSGNTVTLPKTLPVYQQLQADSTFVYHTTNNFQSFGSPNVECVITARDLDNHVDIHGNTYSVELNIDKVQQNLNGSKTVGYSIKVDSTHQLKGGIKKGGIMTIEMY